MHHLRREAAHATFRAEYAAAFRSFLDNGSEAARHAAYELGRDAVSRGVGLLELAQIHHAELATALAHCSPDCHRIMGVAEDFLLEALSTYEMSRRGFTEARERVAYERRQATMIRRLSTLLADASLALHAHSSIEEMLQIVAEQACELTGAAWCIAHARTRIGGRDAIVAHAGAESPNPLRVALEAYAAFDRETEAAPAVQVELLSNAGASMAVPLATLDGEKVGVLAIATPGERPLGELHRAVLIHIGQMTAAALERAMRYHGSLP
jgi:GAF domain-containing protein/phosphoserine phosphatase RsbU-like protein